MTIDERIEQMLKGFEETRRGFERSQQLLRTCMVDMRRQMAARDEITDQRIGRLVAVIGKLAEGKLERKKRIKGKS